MRKMLTLCLVLILALVALAPAVVAQDNTPALHLGVSYFAAYSLAEVTQDHDPWIAAGAVILAGAFKELHDAYWCGKDFTAGAAGALLAVGTRKLFTFRW